MTQGENFEGEQISRDAFVWLIGSLCATNRVPFDARLFLQQFPPPYSVHRLVEATRALQFRLGQSPLSSANLLSLRYPCIAFLRPTGEGEERAPLKPALLVRSDGERLLYFEAGERTPRSASAAQVATLFLPTAYLVSYEGARQEPTGDGVAARKQTFGFRWFAAELLKHKRIWRDVLFASLFLQLIGLTTPLFTQIIIDKVVVHQTQSTLVVIAVGLLMFMLFSAGMTWLRQYFVLHTGNRVDAVLGSQVFRHLLQIPLPFFEQRSTGVLVSPLLY